MRKKILLEHLWHLWKHKTSLRKRILCIAMLAEKPFVDGEQLQAVCDICYIQFCKFSLKHKCSGEGDFGANLAYPDS